MHNASLPRQFSTPDLAANYSSLAKNILNVHGLGNIFVDDTNTTLQIENNIEAGKRKRLRHRICWF